MSDITPRPDVLTRARELRASGASFRSIAGALQAQQYPAGRGPKWHPTSVRNLLNCPHPYAASLAPCTVCGHLTSSEYGICRKPACRNAYQRKYHESRKPEDRRKPCTSCGRPTYSAGGICARPSCWNAYARCRTAAGRGGSLVYAVWFPSPRILKVGFSTHEADSRFIASVRDRAKNRGWYTGGSACIWKQPGDLRTESWMQATLAFRWRAAFQKQDRLCEWFSVPGLTVKEIVKVLGSVYGLVPADVVADGLMADEPLSLF